MPPSKKFLGFTNFNRRPDHTHSTRSCPSDPSRNLPSVASSTADFFTARSLFRTTSPPCHPGCCQTALVVRRHGDPVNFESAELIRAGICTARRPPEATTPSISSRSRSPHRLLAAAARSFDFHQPSYASSHCVLCRSNSIRESPHSCEPWAQLRGSNAALRPLP